MNFPGCSRRMEKIVGRFVSCASGTSTIRSPSSQKLLSSALTVADLPVPLSP